MTFPINIWSSEGLFQRGRVTKSPNHNTVAWPCLISAASLDSSFHRNLRGSVPNHYHQSYPLLPKFLITSRQQIGLLRVNHLFSATFPQKQYTTTLLQAFLWPKSATSKIPQYKAEWLCTSVIQIFHIYPSWCKHPWCGQLIRGIKEVK